MPSSEQNADGICLAGDGVGVFPSQGIVCHGKQPLLCVCLITGEGVWPQEMAGNHDVRHGPSPSWDRETIAQTEPDLNFRAWAHYRPKQACTTSRSRIEGARTADEGAPGDRVAQQAFCPAGEADPRARPPMVPGAPAKEAKRSTNQLVG